MLSSVCSKHSLSCDLSVTLLCAKICAKFKSCAWAVQAALWCVMARERWNSEAVEPQFCWKIQFVPLHLGSTRKVCV